MMNIVRLKNGSEESNVEVTGILTTIATVVKGQPIDLWTLVAKCRGEEDYQFPSAIDRLKRFGLVQQDGSVRDTVRNVVLSAAVGQGRAMTFGDPIAA